MYKLADNKSTFFFAMCDFILISISFLFFGREKRFAKKTIFNKLDR